MIRRYGLAASFVLVVLVLSACTSAAATPTATPKASPSAQQTPAAASATSSGSVTPIVATGALAEFEASVESVYGHVSPSIVNIHVVQQIQSSGPGNALPQFQAGDGSGFVWDKTGNIVTNNHVIDSATKITVTFQDGTVVPATLVGTDVDSDLAVVKINVDASKLQPLTLADSTKVKVGQVVIAIGNPFGLQGTMTLGIVSALNRNLPSTAQNAQGSSYTIPDIIQTDASINPGNSGGALVDDQGNLIGVTSAIISPVQANAGVGFAIPSVIVKTVVPDLIANGKHPHPYVGIAGISMTPDISTAMSLDAGQRGALVVRVTSGGPADKAGLQPSSRQITVDGEQLLVGGDVIVAINGKPMMTFEDFAAYVFESTSIGDTVHLTVLRQGTQQNVDVTLAARPGS